MRNSTTRAAHVGTALGLCLALGCGAQAHGDAPAAGQGGADGHEDAGALERGDTQAAAEAVQPVMCALPPKPSLGACMASVDGEGRTLENPSMTVHGTVEQIAEAEGCDGFGLIGAHAYALTVREGERVHRFTLDVPWQRPIVRSGEAVAVSYSQSIRGIENPPATGLLEIRDEDGALLLWMERSYQSVELLDAPEGMRVSEGTQPCMEEENACGQRTRNALTIRVGSESVEVPFAGFAQLRDYTLFNAEHSVWEPNSCGPPYREAMLAIVRTDRVE